MHARELDELLEEGKRAAEQERRRLGLGEEAAPPAVLPEAVVVAAPKAPVGVPPAPPGLSAVSYLAPPGPGAGLGGPWWDP